MFKATETVEVKAVEIDEKTKEVEAEVVVKHPPKFTKSTLKKSIKTTKMATIVRHLPNMVIESGGQITSYGRGYAHW
ncbi:uncharacterized protein LOC144072770 isoform X4 [Stigmatopora argus]